MPKVNSARSTTNGLASWETNSEIKDFDAYVLELKGGVPPQLIEQADELP